jgi:hypothetical protein
MWILHAIEDSWNGNWKNGWLEHKSQTHGLVWIGFLVM